MTPCPICNQRVTADGMPCRQCKDMLIADLGAVVTWWPELELTMSRQDKVTVPGGRAGKGRERPLPFHSGAATVIERVNANLLAWTVVVTAQDVPDGPMAYWTAPMLAEWLIARENAIWRYERVHDLAGEAHQWVADMLAVIDTPPERIALGQCEEFVVEFGERGNEVEVICGAELTCTREDVQVTCPKCKVVVDVNERRAALLRRAQSAVGTVAVCARVLAMFGLAVRTDTVQNWARPRTNRAGEVVGPPRLWRAASDDRGRAMYRLADVEELAREQMEAQQARIEAGHKNPGRRSSRKAG